MQDVAVAGNDTDNVDRIYANVAIDNRTGHVIIGVSLATASALRQVLDDVDLDDMTAYSASTVADVTATVSLVRGLLRKVHAGGY